MRLLSGGNQQKVVIGKWLSQGADVLIFDEPTHGVDVDGKEEIYEILQELADQGKAVIFISSEFSELVGVCQRIVAMRDGRIMGELEGDEITAQPNIDSATLEGLRARVAERQQAVGYTGDFKEWIERVTPPDLE